MNLKEMVGTTLAVITLMGIGYTAALRGGYVVDEARAQDIAQHKVEQEEKARLEFVRETKFSRLRFLNALENPTPDDRLEMETLRDDIRAINSRIAELEKQ